MSNAFPFARVILDLCGGTGAWSEPYREAGYDVRVVDPVSGGEDVRLFQRLKEPVHGILCAPPCTVFSYARNRYKPTDDELRSALSIVDACLRVVFAHSPVWWALENPINKLRRYLGDPRLTFRQWEYGDGAEKPTGIWGDFVVPEKRSGERTKPSTFGTSRQNADPEDAVTPEGFARAFMEANP